MRPRLTGFGAGNAIVSGSLQWDYVQSNKDLARRVVVFLEDRRVLTQVNEARNLEDAIYCRESANDIRHFLTQEIMNVKDGGELEAAFKWMRQAATAFVTAAGSNSNRFIENPSLFAASLQAFRDTMGQELKWLEEDFGVTLSQELKAITP